jgi:hypothetical protein
MLRGKGAIQLVFEGHCVDAVPPGRGCLLCSQILGCILPSCAGLEFGANHGSGDPCEFQSIYSGSY